MKFSAFQTKQANQPCVARSKAWNMRPSESFGSNVIFVLHVSES